MRIDRLRLPRYRNLVDFEVNFHQQSERQVIVGRNGVGKSNLLEAIVRIFRDLDLEEVSSFEYQIEYFCRGHAVRITNAKRENLSGGSAFIFVRTYEVANHQQADLLPEKQYRLILQADFYKRNRRIGLQSSPTRLLPNYVFGYYSGDISRFEGIFEHHEEKYYADQVRGEEAPLRTLFLARPHHSQFAFLSFLAVDDEKARDFLKNELRIEGLDAVLFALREPYWAKARKGKSSSSGDQRFWGAAGKVEPFLGRLFNNSFVPMAFSERMKISVGQTETKERRFCYLPDGDSVERLAEGLSKKEFFARLESLVFSDVVSSDGSDVRIWLRLKGVEESATFNDLAEGERQLLTVLGLLRFTEDDEALFILDEPDTHLNPAWCLDYLENLRKYGADLATSQIIMTTHSPMTFAGLNRNEVVVLRRDDEVTPVAFNSEQGSLDETKGASKRASVIVAEHPTSSPKGMGFGAILTSDIFGLRSTLDADTLRDVERLRFLAAQPERTFAEEAELARLNASLTPLGFSREVRDPLFKEFVNEMALGRNETPELWGTVLTTEQRARRSRLVASVVRRLKAGQERE